MTDHNPICEPIDMQETIRQQQSTIERLTHIIESVKPYLAAAADGSMSRNNSEQLAAELIAEIEASND